MSEEVNVKPIPELKNVKTLVVEDDEIHMALHLKSLKKLGVESILTAVNGEEAYKLAQTENFDLIISDWMLPGMTGTVLIQKLKELATYRKIPFIICSGSLATEDVFLAAEFDVPTPLVKPVTIEKMSETLRKVMHIDEPLSDLDQTICDFEEKIRDGHGSSLLSQLQSMSENQPDHLKIKELLADCYYDVGDNSSAVELYEEIVKKRPKQIRTISKLSKALLSDKQHKKAIMLMEKLRTLSPNNINRLISLGDAYLDINSPEKAVGAFGKAHSIDKANPQATDGMGKSLMAQGDFHQAFQYLKETQKAEEMASYFNNLGIALTRQGRFDESIKLYAYAASMLPQNHKTPMLVFNIGLSYKKSKDLPTALRYFKAVLDKMPNFDKAMLNLKDIFNIQNKDESVSFDSWLSTIDSSEIHKKLFTVHDSSAPIEISDIAPATTNQVDVEEETDMSMDVIDEPTQSFEEIIE